MRDLGDTILKLVDTILKHLPAVCRKSIATDRYRQTERRRKKERETEKRKRHKLRETPQERPATETQIRSNTKRQ